MAGTADPFDRSHAPIPGHVERLAPGLRVVTAANAGPMTFTGTRSYLVGEGRVAVIDPGPRDAAHRAALLRALGPGERVEAILVTHAHRDHSAGAAALAAETGAPVLAHGDPRGAGAPLHGAAGALGGGEGIDEGFRPDRRIGEGAVIAGPGWTLTAIHTPGHLADHLCFAWAEGEALFTGDTVMGWATTLISPPEGDLGAFMASLERLRARGERVFYPGHGGPVADPQGMLVWQIAHRRAREAQILDALAAGPRTIPDLVAAIYADLAAELRPAAARNVLAHLLDLAGRGVVAADGAVGQDARYRLA
jgi:hydroxyacylglutathione hydrolase